SRFVTMTAVLIVMIVAARVILYFALTPVAQDASPTPFDLFFTTLTMAGVVWLVLELIEGRRFARPRVRLLALSASALAFVAAVYAVAGFASGAILWGYENLLRRVVADTNLDLLHFSLHPLSATRIALEFALVMLHASVVYGIVVVLRVPSLFWRVPATPAARGSVVSGWLAGAAAATLLARGVGAAVPLGPLWLALGATAAAAAAVAHTRGRMR